MRSYFLLLSCLTLLQATAAAQTVALPYRPVAAEYSQALDRVILISGNPNALHVYDAAANKDAVVNLAQPPLSLSISPDGLHAAVGHDALISYVNLSSLAVEKTYAVPVTAGSVVLSPTWIYVMPTYEGGSVSVNIASGAITNNSSVFYGSKGWLNTAVNAIYGTRDGISPNDVEEYDISTGPITRQFDSPYHGDYCIYGPVWFSPDGARIYTGCGTIFRASKDPDLDMYYVSTLPSAIQAFTESAFLHTLALIPPAPMIGGPATNDSVVMMFDSVYLKPLAQFALPPFTITGATFAAHGKWVFFNAASTELIVLSEADNKSGLLNDFAVYRIALNTTPQQCGATFATASADMVATGSIGSVAIQAPDTCVYKAFTSTPWITIVSGGYGSGNGKLTFSAGPNAGGPRTGTITLGNQNFTINQNGASAPGPISLAGFNAVDAAYAKASDKIVLVSAGPDQLHIFDPADSTDQVVALSLAPLSLSVSPDGTHAAVGHDGWVSYVNLQTAQVEKFYQVVTDVSHILLAGNGYMYLFPARDWSDIYSLQISDGSVTATSAIYDGRVPRLHPNGKSMYLGGTSFSKWDISNGVAKLLSSSFGANTCGNLWVTADGRRLFTACAQAYTSSDIPAQDMQYNGTLSSAAALVWADESAEQHATAVIPASNSGSGGKISPGDTQVQIYSDDFLGYQGSIPLPQFTVGDASFPAHGRFVFWNQTGSALFAVVQADSTSGLLAGTGIVRLSPSALVNPNVTTVVNGATQIQGRIAAGEIVTIYGTGIGPATAETFTVDPLTKKVSFNLGGTQVYFDGKPAPVLYASATQVNAIVPFEVFTSGPSVMQVAYRGVLSTGTTLTLATAIPGIFTADGSGSGQAVAVNQDGTVCDATHPAAPGSFITVYFTGGGYTSPLATTGGIADTTLKRLSQTALATVGGQPATVSFAGAAPFMVEGVGQLNLKLADNTPGGAAQPLVLTVGNNTSPSTTTIAVR